ncbi:hypothetical protein ACO0LC_09630 [Undibacterium sp. JH2W]|uniref:hypothetical protein n=1 Tax=Undibacterium sp. JH2W TaxID=3413037 RepID=UPI003BF44438
MKAWQPFSLLENFSGRTTPTNCSAFSVQVAAGLSDAFLHKKNYSVISLKDINEAGKKELMSGPGK